MRLARHHVQLDVEQRVAWIDRKRIVDVLQSFASLARLHEVVCALLQTVHFLDLQ
jgi:hypothetical protein